MWKHFLLSIWSDGSSKVQQISETPQAGLVRLAWKGFRRGLEEHNARDIHHLEETFKNIASFHAKAV